MEQLPASEVRQPEISQISVLVPVCPLCGNSGFGAPWNRFTAAQAAAHFCPPARNLERHERLKQCIRELWAGDSAADYVCPTCDFGFSSPFVGGNADFYGILHEQAGYPQRRWEYDVVQREVLAQHTSGGRVLDVGTGHGDFLLSLGVEWERHATEATPTAQERLRKLGFTVFPDLAAGIREAAGTFQVVTMFQVLEHLAEFKQVLLECRRLLKPGGTLAVSVPDRSAVEVQEQVTGCLDMPPNHVNKWSGPSLSRAMEEAGFQPQPPRVQPPSWRHVPYRLQLKMMTKASSGRTVAAQIYRIRHKPTRVALLAVAGGVAAMASLRTIPRMRVGGALLVIADAI